MALNSINTNIAAFYAQSNISKANQSASSSIARLSSGDRIVRAADDVAALSAGTSLRTNVTTLSVALINTSQGSSLLQVADGALSQITDILQRQKAIAVQAGAGSLTSAERGFLNQEFSNLTDEIDRLAGQTNFNGVTLLDGSLFERTEVEQSKASADAATATLTFVTAAAAETVIINGATFTANAAPAGAQFLDAATAGSIAASVQSLANVLNASTDVRVSQATYEAVNNTLIVTQRGGGQEGETFTINASDADASAGTATADFTVTGRRLTDAAGAVPGAATSFYTLQGSDNSGIARGDTVGVGTIGDTIITTQSQTAAFAVLNYSNSTVTTLVNDFADADVISFDDGLGTLISFEIDNTFGGGAAGVVANNISIDISGLTSKTEVLDRIVNRINTYTGTADYVVGQIEARREGETIVLTKKDAGDVTRADGTTAITAITTASINGSTLTGSATLVNGTNTGITTQGVTNSAFVGTISGFSATFNGTANSIDLSIKVGERTYSASGVNTTAGTIAVPANVRLVSAEGDYFDIGLTGATVTDQDDADTLSARLDKAFSTITFVQTREVSSFDAAGDIYTEGVQTGSLTGSSFELQSANTGPFEIQEVSVRAPLSGQTNGSIEFTINNVVYRSTGNVGSELGANSITQFTSLEDANDVLTFRNGNTVIDFSTNANAQSFEDALVDAFNIGEGGDTLQFQVGVTTEDTLSVSIGNVTTARLFDGASLDVLTAESAATASDALDAAIDAVTSVRAEVGALQSRFDFASANIESSIQNQDAARGALLDTDISAESTAFSTAQVQLQAGIAVLAQANLLPQNLLRLIGQ